jgi:hypothetical protein
VAWSSECPVNRHHVSSPGPILSSSPVRATKSPGRQLRTAAINSGSSPDANVFWPMSRSMSAFIGLDAFYRSPKMRERQRCAAQRSVRNDARLIRTSPSIVRTNFFDVQCASTHLSDPASLTATLVNERWKGLPSAVPRCSVEMRRGPAFL